MKATAMTLGTQLAVGMFVFAFLGHLADKRQGGGSAWTLLGIFMGLFYCAYEVWKLVRRMQEDAAAESREKHPVSRP
jgi:F0F1-type ATP synthase assembly protein I